MLSFRPRLLAAACLAGALSSPLLARDLGWTAEALRPVVARFASAHPEAGLSIAVAHCEGIAWSASCGLADRERRVPAGASTVFELGALSEAFTCLAVMQLREQGLLDLDLSYARYVPEFRVASGAADGITLRRLMAHASGLPDPGAEEAGQPRRTLLERMKAVQLRSEPGHQWHDTALDAALLGLLVERVSGLDFAEYMRRHVLSPMDMPGAGYDPGRLDPARLSAGYHYAPALDLIPAAEVRPESSLRSTVEDASSLLTLLARRGTTRTQRILGWASLDEMLQPQEPREPGHPSGLGFGLRTTAGPRGVPYVLLDGRGRNRCRLVFVPAWSVGFLAAVNDVASGDRFLEELTEAFLSAPDPH